MEQPFSERYGYRSRESNLIYEDDPEQIRQGLREVLQHCDYASPSPQRSVICKALSLLPDPNNWSEYPNIDFEVNQILHGLEWYKFYDLCERLARIITSPEDSETLTPLFQIELNALFREEGIGYEMIESRIEKVGTEEFNEAVDQARQQLGEPRFEVPLNQFNKAMAFRNNMSPDYPNAVKEAVNAVEGAFQIVAAMPGTALPTVLSSLSPQLPSGLKKLYDGLYGYGSGSEGARHASVGGHIPEAEEAEFIIHTAAAANSHRAC